MMWHFLCHVCWILIFNNVYCVFNLEEGANENGNGNFFTNIVLSDPKEVQMFIDAKKLIRSSIAPLLTDLDEIRNLLGVETYNDKK